MLVSVDVGQTNLALCGLRPGADPTGADDAIVRWALVDLKAPGAAAVVDAMRGVAAEWLDDATRVVIERQPAKNCKMRRLEAFLEMWFAVHGKPVALFDPAHKLAFAARSPWWPCADVPESWTYRARKKLSAQTAAAFLGATDQPAAARATFAACRKKDDLSDALLQGMAFAHRSSFARGGGGRGRGGRPGGRGRGRGPVPATAATTVARKKIVARRPTDRQRASGRLSPSNVKWLLHEAAAAASSGDDDAVTRAIAGDPDLRAAIDAHFGSVDACVAALCVV